MRASVNLPPEVLAEIARQAMELLHDRAEPWIGVAEAAEHLACKPQRLYELVHQRRLTPGRDGRRLVFRRSDLDRYLAGGGE